MYKYGGIFTISQNVGTTIKIPNLLVAYFLVHQLICGMDFGFHKLLRKRFRLMFKWFSVFVSLTAILLLFLLVIPYQVSAYWELLTFVRYTAYFIALRTTKYTVLDFMTDITKAFREIPILSKNTVGLVVIAYATLSFVMKCVNSFIACDFLDSQVCALTSYELYIYLIVFICFDFVSVTVVLLFYYIYQCVTFINTLPVDHLVIQEKYIAVANIYDKIMPLYDKLKTIELITELPKLLGTLWFELALFKQNKHETKATWLYYVSEAFYLMIVVIHMVSPAVMAEMIKSRQAALTLRLHQALLEEQDPGSSAALSRLLQYTRCRRLQHYTWGILPVDMRLPLALLNLSITYFVVILQFTHLYD